MILHLTPSEYAEALEIRYRSDNLADFEAYMVNRHGAEYHTRSEIHVVRTVERYKGSVGVWEYCPTCRKITNITWIDMVTWSNEEITRIESIMSKG